MKIMHWEVSETLGAYWASVEQEIGKPIKTGYTSELGPAYIGYRAAAGINPGEPHAIMRIQENLSIPQQMFEAMIAHELTHILIQSTGLWFVQNVGNDRLTGYFIDALGDPAVNRMISQKGFDPKPGLNDECVAAYFNLQHNNISNLDVESTKVFLLLAVKMLLQDLPDNWDLKISNLIKAKNMEFYFLCRKITGYISNFDLSNHVEHNHCLAWLRKLLSLEQDIIFLNADPLRPVTQQEIDFVLALH